MGGGEFNQCYFPLSGINWTTTKALYLCGCNLHPTDQQQTYPQKEQMCFVTLIVL